ncbi:MAG: hypothetical protein AAGA63_00305 [Pseudomonadota bacterium]
MHQVHSETQSGAIDKVFARTLVLATAGWLFVALLFVQIVDPYGVSPIGSRVDGFNAIKPERRDIDRQIKPLEVWQKQPDTIFMGTSRIHQSIDPSIPTGTVFDTAYNASVPANSLGMNVSQLAQYIDINPNLKRVYVELFIYNFLGQNQDRISATNWKSIQAAAPLFFSIGAVIDATATILHNISGCGAVYEVQGGGNFYYPPGHDARGPFAGFPAGIWAMHPKDGVGPQLADISFERVNELISLAAAHDIELTFLATPNHAYSDYYFDYIGGWDLFADWLRQISAKAPLLSFSQPNELVYEPVSASMIYWNDPFHFSLEMGRHMQKSILGTPLDDTPENFMVRISPDNVDSHIAERKAGIRVWAEQNPDVAATMRGEHLKLNVPSGSKTSNTLEFNGQTALFRNRFAGAVERAVVLPDQIQITGWAADIEANTAVEYLVVTAGDRVLAVGVPSSDRPDIRQGLAPNATLAGFGLVVPAEAIADGAELSVYAVMKDGSFARLDASLSQATNGLVGDFSAADAQ